MHICPECRKQYDGTKCPYCGSNAKPKIPKAGCLIILLTAAVLGLWLANEEKPYYVNRDKANYRAAPHGDVLGYMKRNTPVHCVSVSDDWCETRRQDGRTIYFPLKVLTKEPPSASAEVTDGSAVEAQKNAIETK